MRAQTARVRTASPQTEYLDAGSAFLHDMGVVLIVLAPGQVAIAGFARNLERLAAVLVARRALLCIAHGSEVLEVDITAAFLRREGRTAWALGDVLIDVDLEPLPGLDYGALLLDAELTDVGPSSPPWAGADHRARIAEARAAGPARRRR